MYEIDVFNVGSWILMTPESNVRIEFSITFIFSLQVSLMSKLVPSPDWFVGLDSLDLCKNGRFVDSVQIEVSTFICLEWSYHGNCTLIYLCNYSFFHLLFQADPIDAGTDNGFTFTSPNWPTVPKAAIFRITNVYPSHPAGSFWYPEKDMLPSIATFTFLKVNYCFFVKNLWETFYSYSYKSVKFHH